MKHYQPALILFIPTVASTIYTVVDKTLIGALIKETIIDTNGNIMKVSDVENGMYEQTEKLVKMMITVLSVLRMARISLRCGFAICGKAAEGFALAYMPAARRIHDSKLFFQI